MTESMLASFFHGANTPLAVLDPAGTFVHLNDGWKEVVKDAAALRGKRLPDIFKSDDAQRAREAVGRLRAEAPEILDGRLSATVTGSIERVMRFHLTQDETTGYIRLTAIAGTARAEHANRLALFDDIVMAPVIAVFTLDAHGNFTTWEGGGAATFGAPPGGLVGKSALVHWQGTDAAAAIERGLGGEGAVMPITLPGPLHAQFHLVPIRGASGKPDGLIGFAADLTAEREAQAQLVEKIRVVEQQNATVQMFQRVLETASVVLWSMDRNGVCTLSEGKGLELLGLKAGETVGMNLLELYKDNEEVASDLVRALGGEELRTLSSPVPGVYIEGWNMPIRHAPDGEISGVLGFAMDATERVKNETEMREKLQLIERQSATIRALATPIIQVWDEVLCLPVIGTVDSARTADMMQSLLEAIVREEARFAIVDLTGVEVVDTSTADHLIQLFRAARVLGTDGVLCGIRPAVAQTVVALGLDLASVRMMRSLRDALKWCIRERGRADRARGGGMALLQTAAESERR